MSIRILAGQGLISDISCSLGEESGAGHNAREFYNDYTSNMNCAGNFRFHLIHPLQNNGK